MLNHGVPPFGWRERLCEQSKVSDRGGPMKLPDLLPPPDLLQRIDGVEDGLRKRRRLGLAGVVGVLVSGLTWFTNLRNVKQVDVSNLASDWPLLLGLIVFVTSVLLAIWARFWLQETRRPFSYSYYVEHFEPVEGTVIDPRLAFLAADLSERLSERIMRLSRFDERAADPKVVAERTSHLHVTGYYLIRLDTDRRWVVEVTPWVRLGPIGERETLALPVKVPIGDTAEVALGRPSRWGRGSEGAHQAAPTHAAEPPALTVELYDTILERIYFSIATQVYKQIRHDVQRKIDLLPTRYFRAVAYHNEARTTLSRIRWMPTRPPATCTTRRSPCMTRTGPRGRLAGCAAGWCRSASVYFAWAAAHVASWPSSSRGPVAWT
jgi:hypothetical protein